jgi:phosphoglycerol transferase
MRLARHPEVRYALLAVLATSVLASLVLRLWDATLGISFLPGGDGYLVLMQVKGVLDNGWVLSNPDLGAPFGQELHDYAANREVLNVAAVKLLGLFSSNPVAVFNVYFLLSFPLAALTAFLVLRWLRISRWTAVALSVIYALTPYHFRHQTFLFAYYTVPVAAYLVLAVYAGAPLFERRPSRRTLFTLGLCVAVALSGIYYAAFTVILVLVAGAIAFVASRRGSSLVAGAAIAAAIVLTGLVASAPDLVYRAQHGSNPVVGVRSAHESQIYSLNPLQLVMPIEDHRFAPFRDLHRRWAGSTPVDQEPTHLGLIAALGFVWLLVLAVAIAAGASGRIASDLRQRHLAAATLTALLVGTTGGIGAFIAYVISPQLRAWTRLDIFIAFFALAALGLLLDAGQRHLARRGVRWTSAGFAALLASLCVLAVLDQTNPSTAPDYAANAAAYRSDEAFAHEIEETLGDGEMVLQLPYVPFPENGPVGGTGPYDHVRPYLHTDSVRWSFGSMKGRPDDWQAALAGAPPETLLPAIAAAGFAGVYVDRSGYPDGARDLELELDRELDTKPITSPDGRFSFFDLRRYARALRARAPAANLRALADATLEPLETDWGGAFSTHQQEGVESARWAVTADASVAVTNPSKSARSATLFVRLTRSGGDPATVAISYPDGANERVEVPPEGTEVERTLSFPPGDSTVRLVTEAGAIAAPAGVPTGYVQLVGWRLTPATP